jgi:hypothetical protein
VYISFKEEDAVWPRRRGDDMGTHTWGFENSTPTRRKLVPDTLDKSNTVETWENRRGKHQEQKQRGDNRQAHIKDT